MYRNVYAMGIVEGDIDVAFPAVESLLLDQFGMEASSLEVEADGQYIRTYMLVQGETRSLQTQLEDFEAGDDDDWSFRFDSIDVD